VTNRIATTTNASINVGGDFTPENTAPQYATTIAAMSKPAAPNVAIAVAKVAITQKIVMSRDESECHARLLGKDPRGACTIEPNRPRGRFQQLFLATCGMT
jgi:hypothetical protein